MIFKIPGKSFSLRLFEPVETVDDQYHVYDVGVQYAEGGIDSLAVGAATHTASKWIDNINREELELQYKKQQKREKKAAKKAADKVAAGIPDTEPESNDA